MSATYELRSPRGHPMFAYDNLARAIEAKTLAEKRAGTTLRLVEIIRTEREITAASPARDGTNAAQIEVARGGKAPS